MKPRLSGLVRTAVLVRPTHFVLAEAHRCAAVDLIKDVRAALLHRFLTAPELGALRASVVNKTAITQMIRIKQAHSRLHAHAGADRLERHRECCGAALHFISAPIDSGDVGVCRIRREFGRARQRETAYFVKSTTPLPISTLVRFSVSRPSAFAISFWS